MLPRGCSPSPGNRRRPERPFPGSKSKGEPERPRPEPPPEPPQPGHRTSFCKPSPHGLVLRAAAPSKGPRLFPEALPVSRPAARRQPPAAGPKPAHLRSRSPSSAPSRGVWNRSAAPPPALPALAPPPRRRNCSLPGPFPRLLGPNQCGVTSACARLRAGCPGLAHAPRRERPRAGSARPADDNKFVARPLWRCPPHRGLRPCRLPACSLVPSLQCRLGPSSDTSRPPGLGLTGTLPRLVPSRPSASGAAQAMGSP